MWEWTRSLWGKSLFEPDFVYPYKPNDAKREDLKAGNDVLRVVRGGSWIDLRHVPRCAYRVRARPGFRNDSLGFRVVLRSPPIPQL